MGKTGLFFNKISTTGYPYSPYTKITKKICYSMWKAVGSPSTQLHH